MHSLHKKTFLVSILHITLWICDSWYSWNGKKNNDNDDDDSRNDNNSVV